MEQKLNCGIFSNLDTYLILLQVNKDDIIYEKELWQLYAEIHGYDIDPYKKVTVCLSVPKDFANR